MWYYDFFFFLFIHWFTSSISLSYHILRLYSINICGSDIKEQHRNQQHHIPLPQHSLRNTSPPQHSAHKLHFSYNLQMIKLLPARERFTVTAWPFVISNPSKKVGRGKQGQAGEPTNNFTLCKLFEENSWLCKRPSKVPDTCHVYYVLVGGIRPCKEPVTPWERVCCV